MSFLRKHQPQSVSDLVFADPTVAKIIREYAAGVRTDHLLLEGPSGSGKSSAARLIWQARTLGKMCAAYPPVHYGKGFDETNIKRINGEWAFQMLDGIAYTIIDEVDAATPSARYDIRNLIDNTSYGTVICTTNHLHKLEPAFIKRFEVVSMQVPAVGQWWQRALYILRQEGHSVSLQHLQGLMAGFDGDVRDFVRRLETVSIDLNAARNGMSSQQATVTAKTPVTIAGGTVQLTGPTSSTVRAQSTP
jgi:replication factor C subunit 3/5